MTDTNSEEENPQSAGVPTTSQLTFETALLILKASKQLPGTVTEAEII